MYLSHTSLHDRVQKMCCFNLPLKFSLRQRQKHVKNTASTSCRNLLYVSGQKQNSQATCFQPAVFSMPLLHTCFYEELQNSSFREISCFFDDRNLYTFIVKKARECQICRNRKEMMVTVII